MIEISTIYLLLRVEIRHWCSIFQVPCKNNTSACISCQSDWLTTCPKIKIAIQIVSWPPFRVYHRPSSITKGVTIVLCLTDHIFEEYCCQSYDMHLNGVSEFLLFVCNLWSLKQRHSNYALINYYVYYKISIT